MKRKSSYKISLRNSILIHIKLTVKKIVCTLKERKDMKWYHFLIRIYRVSSISDDKRNLAQHLRQPSFNLFGYVGKNVYQEAGYSANTVNWA